MSDGMGRELAYLSSHATNRYFIPNWGNMYNTVTANCNKNAETINRNIQLTEMRYAQQ